MENPVYFDFMTAFPMAEIKPPAAGGEPKVLLYEFVRRGQRRKTITTIADSEVRFNLPIIKPNSELRFHIAMPFNIGDGAEAQVFLMYGNTSDLLYQVYLDPARNAQHRDWIAVNIDLGRYEGIRGAMLFSARATTGDFTADWIGWAEPRLVSKQIAVGDMGTERGVGEWERGREGERESDTMFLPFPHSPIPPFPHSPILQSACSFLIASID